MTRGVGLVAVLAGLIAACGQAVRPTQFDDAGSTGHPADAASHNSGRDTSDGDATAPVVCDDLRSSFIQPPGDCITTGLRCTDGTTRYSRCLVPTQTCQCTIVGGRSFECAATTGYTPPACENVRNCCWE
jgi:hypothetical protein